MSPVTSVLGIDVAKAKLDVVLLGRAESPKHAVFENTQAGFLKLEKWLNTSDVHELHACLEATGMYGEALAQFLSNREYQVSVVNPARIKAYAHSQLIRSKTDKLDAQVIADFCLNQHPDLWTPPDPDWTQLREMTRHLQALGSICQQERNRLQAGYTSPDVLHLLQDHVAFLEQQMSVLTQRIQFHIRQSPTLRQRYELLISIPGIGAITAARLIAEIRDIRLFRSAAQLAAFAGLTPRHHPSGSSVHSYTPISKVGNPGLRKRLYFPAITARRYNPVIADFCSRLATRGKRPKVIIAAAMRKLLHIVFGVLKSGKPFNPNLATERTPICP